MLTHEQLKDNLEYNPDNGIFTRLITHTHSVKIGDVAGGSNNNGYTQIRVLGKMYQAHRLAWLYMTGDWPDKDLDHINQIRDDNRWPNLRECTKSQNGANAEKNKNNTSGYKGVSWHKPTKKWLAKIRHKNKDFHLGCFKYPHEAAKAYNSKALELFGEFAYLNVIND